MVWLPVLRIFNVCADADAYNCSLGLCRYYWVIQAGVVNSLDFCPASLLLPVRTFFTMAGGDSEFANFTLPTIKTFLEARSQNVLYDASKSFSFSTNSRSSGQEKNDAKTLFFHPPSRFPAIFATATVVAFVLLRSSRFNFHCYTQREATPSQKLAWKWHCDLSRLLAWKITKGIHWCKPASLNRPITHSLFAVCWLKGRLYNSLLDCSVLVKRYAVQLTPCLLCTG